MYKEFMQHIENGTKTCTIREEHRLIPLEKLTISATHKDHSDIPVTVKKIEYTTLGQITDAQAKQDGFQSARKLRQQMRKIYVKDLKHEMESTHPITIVYFEK